MEIVVQTLDTHSIAREQIKKSLKKLYESGQDKTKINRSLDLTRPEYIEAEIFNDKNGTFYRCRYFVYSADNTEMVCVYTGDIYDSNIDHDVDVMLCAAESAAEKNYIEEKAYRLYQLEWMMSHGFSLSDLFSKMVQCARWAFDPSDFLEKKPDGYIGEDEIVDAAMKGRDYFLNETGFGGQLFACKREFLDAEYKDSEYMENLFDTQPGKEADRLKTLYRKYLAA
ncbi:MAG: hypothetical protein K6G10_02635 [Butyrivibrio sp.]|nr:hypothetical protein [Butyrivibrio sp.]